MKRRFPLRQVKNLRNRTRKNHPRRRSRKPVSRQQRNSRLRRSPTRKEQTLPQR